MNKMELIMEARFLDLTRAMEEYIESKCKGIFIFNVGEKSYDDHLERICAEILGVKSVTIYETDINRWRAEAVYENQENVIVDKNDKLNDPEKYKLIKGSNHKSGHYADVLTDEEKRKVDELLEMLSPSRTRNLRILKHKYENEAKTTNY